MVKKKAVKQKPIKKKPVKKRASKYNNKLSISGTLDEVLKVSVPIGKS